MDLDEERHSFYFIYSYEVNRHLYGKKLAENYVKIKQRFSDLRDPNKEVKLRYLKEYLVKIYVDSIKPVCYFCDKNYENKCLMNDVSEFRNLFNFTYLKASRPLDDDESDHSHMLSKQMIKMVRLDEEWNKLIQTLPDELLKPIQNGEIDRRVRETSLNCSIRAHQWRSNG